MTSEPAAAPPPHPPVEVADARGPVAWLTVGVLPTVTTVEVENARSQLLREEAALVLAGVEAVVGDRPTITLATSDAVLRDQARRAGFVGGLRAPLRRGPHLEVGSPTVAEFLPDASVAVDEAAHRRAARWLTTGLDRAARFTARRDAAIATVVAPTGPDALAEPIAATLDTLLDLDARLGAAAERVPRVRFSRSSAGMSSGRIAGENAGAWIALNPMYVDVGALAQVRRRRDRHAMPRPVPSGRGPRAGFWIDEVVVHEVGHSIDQAVATGRLSDTVGFRREVGSAVGVESIELALRGAWAQSPPEWGAARERVVQQLSEYATTNCVEFFAEAFVAWYRRDDAPIAAAMDRILRHRYPNLP